MSFLSPDTRVAICAGDKIGDTLISMVFARNFRDAGYMTTIFSTTLGRLTPFFPGYDVKPTIKESNESKCLDAYQLRLFPANGEYLRHVDPKLERELIKRGAPYFKAQRPLSRVFATLCEKSFGLKSVTSDPGMHLPEGKPGAYKKRIAIHPTSSRKDKNWSRSKFIKLVHYLQQDGYEPHLIMAPYELKGWEIEGVPISAFDTLTETAHFLYESGFFIGNDSGLGHLASALHRPTLTLCPRVKQGRRWGPAWAEAHFVYPWLHLPGPKLKELFWKRFISTKRVHRVLLPLLERHCV
jgi:hypothetical protein